MIKLISVDNICDNTFIEKKIWVFSIFFFFVFVYIIRLSLVRLIQINQSYPLFFKGRKLKRAAKNVDFQFVGWKLWIVAQNLTT